MGENSVSKGMGVKEKGGENVSVRWKRNASLGRKLKCNWINTGETSKTPLFLLPCALVGIMVDWEDRSKCLPESLGPWDWGRKTAFGEYIKFFKGCSVVNTEQAGTPERFPSEVLRKGEGGSRPQRCLRRLCLLMNDSSQLILTINIFLCSVGVEKGEDAQIHVHKSQRFNFCLTEVWACF